MSTNALNKLKADLATFSTDTINMIKIYWPETSIKTNLIFVMFQMRDTLRKKSDPELSEKLLTLRTDFAKYIDDKIAKKLGDRDDLFFEIREIAKTKLSLGVGVAIADLERSNIQEPLKSQLIEELKNMSYEALLKLIPEGG